MSGPLPPGSRADQQARLEVARAALRAVTEQIRRRSDGAAPPASAPPIRAAEVRERPAAYGWAAPVPAPARAPEEGFGSPALAFPRGAVPAELPLRELEYAVVDVETTGGSPLMGHRLTEVGVVVVRGSGEVVGEYGTLVNPARPIPRGITRITNITNEMVADAPAFREVAETVRHVTHGRVFVAHNAGFDLRFLGVELLRATGRPYEREPLCTVRLSRRLLPEVRRRSLDSVCGYFGIPIEGRHRALGDARATAVLLLRLLERAQEQSIATWGLLEQLLTRRRGRRKRSALPRSMDWA